MTKRKQMRDLIGKMKYMHVIGGEDRLTWLCTNLKVKLEFTEKRNLKTLSCTLNTIIVKYSN